MSFEYLYGEYKKKYEEKNKDFDYEHDFYSDVYQSQYKEDIYTYFVRTFQLAQRAELMGETEDIQDQVANFKKSYDKAIEQIRRKFLRQTQDIKKILMEAIEKDKLPVIPTQNGESISQIMPCVNGYTKLNGRDMLIDIYEDMVKALANCSKICLSDSCSMYTIYNSLSDFTAQAITTERDSYKRLNVVITSTASNLPATKAMFMFTTYTRARDYKMITNTYILFVDPFFKGNVPEQFVLMFLSTFLFKQRTNGFTDGLTKFFPLYHPENDSVIDSMTDAINSAADLVFIYLSPAGYDYNTSTMRVNFAEPNKVIGETARNLEIIWEIPKSSLSCDSIEKFYFSPGYLIKKVYNCLMKEQCLNPIFVKEVMRNQDDHASLKRWKEEIDYKEYQEKQRKIAESNKKKTLTRDKDHDDDN